MRCAHPPHFRAPRAAHRGSTLVGVFVGLVIGVLIAAALAWYFSRPYEFQQTGPTALPGALQSGAAPIALPGKPGDKPVEGVRPPAPAEPKAPAQSAPGDTKFDFYDILTKGDQAALPAPEASAPAAPAERLYLQVGAFTDPSDADNLKARLALLGVEAAVYRLESADKGTLHRVRVGPYSSPEDMNAVRAELAKDGITSSVVKVKPKEARADAPVAP